MTWPLRDDAPGAMHHVMNRALGRRTLFETEEDARSFLARAADAVRRGEIRLHSFTLLTTHFHLIVTSVDGRLSASIGRTESEFARGFNDRRTRDGPLVRGRFRSKRI